MSAVIDDVYAKAIETVFGDFKLDAKVVGRTEGPSVTRYEVALGPGVRVEKVEGLQKNIAYTTAAESVRLIAPIPGKTAVGIELPREQREIVTLAKRPAPKHPLEVYIGEDVEGNPVTANLTKLPHLLVAGTTGSGKSSFINSLLVPLLDTDPDKVQLVLIDPKMVELTPYNGVAHLARPVITEVDEAIEALKELALEMEERYDEMRRAKVRSIETLDLPYIVVVIDELADLMMAARDEIESNIVRLAQKARAAGIHLILATQRPSVDVVTGLIKANVPSRLAFATSSLTDSRVILDEAGAEQLLGNGDGLFKPVGARGSIRIQGALVTDAEIGAAVQRAEATAEVEEMVDRLYEPDDDPEIPVLDYINDLIAHCQAASKRAGDYMEKLCAPKKRGLLWGDRGGKMDLLTQAPAEMGRATDALFLLERKLTLLRDAVLEVTP
ncbi:Cell division protein [Mycolicibacterium phlei]|nr:Cell division protein [Mycolicibacterium phlei]